MRVLTPAFVLDNLVQRQHNDHFYAVVLFVDNSGFTPLTTRLMAHGKEGAEALADILRAVFEPLIESVYAQDGFIAGFAGDAFKAVFPSTVPRKLSKRLGRGRADPHPHGRTPHP